jgi:glutathione peroxidase
MAALLEFPRGPGHDEGRRPIGSERAEEPGHPASIDQGPFPESPTVIERIALLILPVVALLVCVPRVVAADEPARRPTSVLDFSVKDIDGKSVALSRYKGEVLLVVNTASQCGYTPQYQGMEAVHQRYKGRGFEVLAFPANEFGAQEPGSNSEIKAFCTSNYNVTFPIFSKIVVKGPEIHPFYQFLTNAKTDPKFAGDISWNFNKFLIDRDGKVIARFDSGDGPESAKVTRAIEAALAGTK